MKLGEALVKEGIITRQQLNQALGNNGRHCLRDNDTEKETPRFMRIAKIVRLSPLPVPMRDRQ